MAGSPDTDHGYFGGTGPAEYIAGVSDYGTCGAGLVELVDARDTDFFERGDGVGASCAVAEETNEGEPVVLEFSDLGGVAEEIVPCFVSAFCGRGFEDSCFCLSGYIKLAWLR